MAPKSVWVIERGSYSDYGVEGIYTSREKAERVCEALNAGDTYEKGTVSEWSLDPGYEAIRAGRYPFSVTMLRDGTVERVTRDERSYYNLNDGFHLWKRTEAPAYRGKGVPDALSGTAWAKDAEHAIKIASEHRAQMIANGEWPETTEAA